jgi:hypothetical protein
MTDARGTKGSKKSGQDTSNVNPDLIPTKELLRMRRKADYQKAKAQRKADNLARKQEALEAKRKARAQRDEELWAALRRGSELETSQELP